MFPFCQKQTNRFWATAHLPTCRQYAYRQVQMQLQETASVRCLLFVETLVPSLRGRQGLHRKVAGQQGECGLLTPLEVSGPSPKTQRPPAHFIDSVRRGFCHGHYSLDLFPQGFNIPAGDINHLFHMF